MASLFVPADFVSPLDAVLIDPATGVVTSSFPFIQPAGSEAGARIPATGIMAFSRMISSIDYTDELVIVGSDFTTIATITSLITPAYTSYHSPWTHDRASTFYWANADFDQVAAAVVHTISAAGVVGGTTWTLPTGTKSERIGCIALDPDLDILYWQRFVNNDPTIYRYDLAGNAPLSDLVAGTFSAVSGIDLYVLTDGTILSMYGGLAPNRQYEIRRHSAAGALLNQYTIGGSVAPTGTPPRFCVSDDETTLYSMSFVGDGPGGTSRFKTFDLATEVELLSFDLQNDVGAGAAGEVSQSCPLLYLTASAGAGGVIGPYAWVHFPRRVP
jgi:hypothetical protein